jgi:hypothetical protein
MMLQLLLLLLLLLFMMMMMMMMMIIATTITSCVFLDHHVTVGLQDSDSDVQRVQQLQGVSYDKAQPLTPSNTTHHSNLKSPIMLQKCHSCVYVQANFNVRSGQRPSRWNLFGAARVQVGGNAAAEHAAGIGILFYILYT